MSETDDTDELLIIPPDFFLVDSDEEYDISTVAPYYGVVDSLIIQVNTLQERIDFIENTQSISSLDSFNMHSPSAHNLCKFSSSEEIHKPQRQRGPPESAQSTPQKPKTKFALNSLPNSPNVDRYSPKRPLNLSKKAPEPKNPHNENNKELNDMLGEVDNFISSVRTIERISASRNLENDYEKSPNKTEKTWQSGDNIGSVPDYGFGVRSALYADNLIRQPIIEQTNKASVSLSSQTPSTSSISTRDFSFAAGDKRDSDNDSDSTQVTALNKFKQALKKSDSPQKAQKSVKDTPGFDLELVSLSNLWNANADLHDNSMKFQQKLQEEKLRRQHCEEMVQKLQNHVLELQERLAVAVKVDEAKDRAILRYHDAWESITTKMQSTDKEKIELKQEIYRIQNKSARELEEARQKIKHYEEEASKALNLAHNNQEKLTQLERHCTNLENELGIIKKNYEDLQKSHRNELEKNKRFPEILAQKEIELNENRNILIDVRKEVTESRKAVEMCQNDLKLIKNECSELQLKLDEEKKSSRQLTEQKRKLMDEIDAHKNVEKSLQEELSKSRSQLESIKTELKNFYQGQLELVVQNKVKEFQNQLDQAENSLKDELKKKELVVTRNAALHIQQICEKNNIEINLLEEKHKEEIKLYQIKLSQCKQQIDEMSNRLKKQQEKRALIDRQLIKFMEALHQDDSVSSIAQLNSFKSKSFLDIEEILSQNNHEIHGDGFAKLRLDEPIKSSAPKNSNATSFFGDSIEQSIFRNAGEPPVLGRKNKSKPHNEKELQKFIHMLLNKQPGNPVEDQETPESARNDDTSSDVGAWQTGLNDGQKGVQRDRKYEKPPWK